MPITGPDGQRESVHERAESRRTALKALLEKEGITVAELARRAGLQRPNSLYNFFTGRTASLSSVTLTKIKEACPSADVLSLMGAPAPLQVAPRYVPAQHVGIGLTPHQFRHLAAHLFLRDFPGHYEEVRLFLGHASIATTIKHYAGTPG